MKISSFCLKLTGATPALLLLAGLNLFLTACIELTPATTPAAVAVTTANPASATTFSLVSTPTTAPTMTSSTSTSSTAPHQSATAGSSLSRLTQPCLAAGLSPELRFENGATGWSLGHLYFTNHGSAACTLQGYPELQALDEKGQLDPNAIYTRLKAGSPLVNNASPEQAVAIKPGETAAVFFEKFRCDLGTYPEPRRLNIILPGNQGQLLLPDGPNNCQGTPSLMNAGPFYAPPANWRNLP